MTTILETQRLRLREFEPGDAASLFALDSDPEVMRFIGDGSPCRREDVERAITRVRDYYRQRPGLGIWLAEQKDSGEFVGWACLKHLNQTDQIELGYRLMRFAWNQGFATEAGLALIQYGRQEHKLTEIVAVTHPDNKASQRVLEKCGMVRIGIGEYYGVTCYLYELSDSCENRPS